ncbi:MAG TPA: ATPase domain-containing protein [Candidatus Binatia bacterium]|nr:ATPase domain-containing protein [Candidatus Binatia bacterium]
MDDHSPQTHEIVRTGIPGLDEVLLGGLTPERMYLVEGDPGAGKTTLGLRFLFEGMEQGQSGVYVSLSETRDELEAVAQSHGWTLGSLTVIELAPGEESLSAEAENTMFYPSEMELSDTTRRVLEQIERVKPARVVFDSLSEMRLLAQNPLRYRRQILALKQFFIGRHATVLLLDDRTSDSTDVQLHSLAHGVITLERHTPTYGVMGRRLQVQKMRGRRFRSGFHDYVIEFGGLQVFPRLVAADHTEERPVELLGTGVPALDQITGGGIERGSSTLLVGPAGSGKSTLSAQFGTALAERGGRAAFFLFDESVTTLLTRSDGLKIPLRRMRDAGKVALHRVDPGQVSPGEFVAMVREEVERHDARMIVIDSINGYLNAMPEVRHVILQLHELLTYLRQRGVTAVMVVAQHGVLGTGQSPVDASYLADSVLLLRYFEADGQVRQTLSVLKKRSGAHERTLRELRMGPSGIQLSEPLREFEGVLTGVPAFHGRSTKLLKPEAA